MKVNKAEIIVGCDIDGTLVRPVEPGTPGAISITNPYSKIERHYIVHKEHVELLRMYKGRGFYNIVWSANGTGHAESVVRALGLDDGTVDEVMTKCMKYIDDKKDASLVVGAHVFIPETGFTVS